MRTRSLRTQLLAWLLAPLAIVAALDAAVTYHGAVNTATLIQDRLLLGSARTIAEQIQVTDGIPNVAIPPSALEMLDAGYQDHIYYKISAPDGHLLSGYGEMAPPPHVLQPETWIGFDALYRDQAIRVIAFSQPLFTVDSESTVGIEVGQTTNGRDALARDIWQHAVREQLIMLLLVTGLLLVGLRRGLKPLTALRDQVARRQRHSTDAIDVGAAPSELLPVIAAFNDYTTRLNRHMQSHDRFIADASHQLRTPLTILNMQIAFALRQEDAASMREVLQAIRTSIQSNIRLVNQLMAFTEAESGLRPGRRKAPIHLEPTVRTVIEELASLADARSIDLGFEDGHTRPRVQASAHQVHVLASNLIDNALRYTQPGGVVTVRLGEASDGRTTLQVVDDGPGIPLAERDRVFERFVRLEGSNADGCGLGLAIVKEIADDCGAGVQLESGPQDRGLCVTVSFPTIVSVSAVPRRPGRVNAPYRRTAADAT